MSTLDRRAILEWCLRRTDQLAVALIVAVGGGLLASTVIWQAVLHRRWIDIERDFVAPEEFRVDLNQADWPELALLPGIGETVARNLVQYRSEHGPFQSLAELLRVPGVGPRTLEKIGPHLEPLESPEPQRDDR
jgi:competence protein ComEA